LFSLISGTGSVPDEHPFSTSPVNWTRFLSVCLP
jgi:hypothetical protein